jgi:hypothetical protein
MTINVVYVLYNALLGRAQEVVLLLDDVYRNFISYVAFFAKRNDSFPKESHSSFRCHYLPLLRMSA